MKRMLCMLLALGLMTAGGALAGDALFPAVNPYPGLADVAERDDNWYYAPVKACYESGLMMGTGRGFEPNSPITVAEVAAISARLAEAVSSKPIPRVAGDQPWYAPYLLYLEEYGLTGLTPTDKATRSGFFAMLAKVTPDSLLTPINQITRLPDTESADVLKFYNAGILTGVDPSGLFAGDKGLTRAEAAAMVARLIRPELRQTFTPVERPADWDEPSTVRQVMQALGIEEDTVMLDFGGENQIAAELYLYVMTGSPYLEVKAFWQEHGYADVDWWSLSMTVNGVAMTTPQAIQQLTVNYFTRLALEAQTGAAPDKDEVAQYLSAHSVVTDAAKQLDIRAICEKHDELFWAKIN